MAIFAYELITAENSDSSIESAVASFQEHAEGKILSLRMDRIGSGIPKKEVLCVGTDRELTDEQLEAIYESSEFYCYDPKTLEISN